MADVLRADARRNVGRILQAAVETLGRDPSASMQDIAAAAGVGRVTVYAHFSSRPALIEAALEHAIAEGDTALQSVDLAGDPTAALERLVGASWALSAASANVLAAGRDFLGAERILELHARPVERAGLLLRRGQDAGAFRSDLPSEWLVSSLHALMKHALDEVEAGRLTPATAQEVVTASAQALWARPDEVHGSAHLFEGRG